MSRQKMSWAMSIPGGLPKGTVYGLVLGLTATAVGLLLTAADGLTLGILHKRLISASFQEAMHATVLLQVTVDVAEPVVLGVVAFLGTLPVGIGYILEILFRQAAALTLVAAVPFRAADLLAGPRNRADIFSDGLCSLVRLGLLFGFLQA